MKELQSSCVDRTRYIEEAYTQLDDSTNYLTLRMTTLLIDQKEVYIYIYIYIWTVLLATAKLLIKRQPKQPTF